MIFETPLHQALCEALDDEYKARATYQAVIDAFGPILPFANIIQSEQRHINALLSLFSGRGLPAIHDPYALGMMAPESIEEACRIGVEAEIENAALYDRLMQAAAGDEEVLWVFRALRRASNECHLPAFRRRLNGAQGASCGCGDHEHGHGQDHGHHCGCGGRRHQPIQVSRTASSL